MCSWTKGKGGGAVSGCVCVRTGNGNLDAVENCAEAGDDERGGDGVLLELDVSNVHAELHDDERGHDETYL